MFYFVKEDHKISSLAKSTHTLGKIGLTLYRSLLAEFQNVAV